MKKQLRPKIRTDGRTTEKHIDYDEVGNIKEVNENGITTLYNIKNGVYQSDPYNFVTSKNTQNLQVQYSYNKKNILESVRTPDGTEIKYERNVLNEIKNIEGWIKNCEYYSDKLLKNYETVTGIEGKREYDAERNLSNLSYTQDSNVLDRYEYEYDKNFNLIRKNKNTYSYDALNRLCGVYECDGKYERLSDEEDMNLYETEKDVAAKKKGETLIKGQAEVVLDAGAKSLIADFGNEQLISKIKICPNYKVTRVYADNVSLYIGSEDGEWRAVTNCGKKKNEKDGSITIILRNYEKGRYIKVHNLYDERTYNNEIETSRSNFRNSAEKIIQITTVGSVLDERYDYDSISNRTEYVSNHKKYKVEYHKNHQNGNSSLVKNDGIYEYKYDNNGNRISKEGNGEAWKYEWDLHNRLIKVEMESNGNKMVEVSYRYDHENNKLRRESDGNTVEYMYDFEGKLLYESEGPRKRSYVYMGRSLVGFSEGGRKYHVITDETGSVRKIYKDGEEEWSGTYSPYGKLMSKEGELEFTALYAGKEIDTETGLTYHWNRWRNEEGDAFISEDPIRDGYNWYGYANANPFRYADGTGLATYVCRDGTFCNEGDISNPSYRADCYHYNGYNAGTIASMSGPAYNRANNGGQATLSLAGTRADPGRNKSSPSAAEEIKNCGNVDVEKYNCFYSVFVLDKEAIENNLKDYLLNLEGTEKAPNFGSIKLSENTYILGSNLHTDVEVHVFRPSDGYSNKFDSIRLTISKSKSFGTTYYYDFIGANAINENAGMTLPPGTYHLTNIDKWGSVLSQKLKNGMYDSGNFHDVLRIITDDKNISSNIRSIINKEEGDYYLHAAEYAEWSKKGRYPSGGPYGAGCNISESQFAQERFMNCIRMATNLSDINYYIH